MKTNTTQKRHQIQVQTYSKEITFLYKDARVHYVVLKQQPHHTLPEQQQTLTEHPPKPFSRLCAGNQKSTTLVVVSGPNSVPNT